MKEPFNSQAPHFLTKVKTYCAKVLPLVFDNSLSYYEFLGKVCHKLNECIDALNSQNLNIIEFTHMVQLEIENFEKYIDNRITEFEDELKKAWEEYKEELNKAFADFKNEMLTAWEEEKAINEKFRTDLLNDFNSFKTEITTQQERFETQIKADFNTYKETVNAEIEQFEQATNADLSAFKNTMQTQQNEFENHMVELFNNFKTTEKQARTDFESNFQQLFEQWKIDTLYALNENISDWETDTNTALMSAIEEKIDGYVATFNAQLNQLSLDLNAEREDRRQHDESLQNQINQLTPEGAIKADDPDSDGNSQLYTIDKTTQQRTNIFPKTNTPTGGSTVKFLTHEGGVAVNSEYFYIESSKSSFLVANSILLPADTIINDAILIPKSLITDDESIQPILAFLTLGISITTCQTLRDTGVYTISPYIHNSSFVEYNSIRYLSIPLILTMDKIDNSTGLGAGRCKFIVTILKINN